MVKPESDGSAVQQSGADFQQLSGAGSNASLDFVSVMQDAGSHSRPSLEQSRCPFTDPQALEFTPLSHTGGSYSPAGCEYDPSQPASPDAPANASHVPVNAAEFPSSYLGLDISTSQGSLQSSVISPFDDGNWHSDAGDSAAVSGPPLDSGESPDGELPSSLTGQAGCDLDYGDAGVPPSAGNVDSYLDFGGGSIYDTGPGSFRTDVSTSNSSGPGSAGQKLLSY